MGDDGEREAGESEAGESEIIEFTDFETEERSQRRQRIADLERSWLAHRARTNDQTARSAARPDQSREPPLPSLASFLRDEIRDLDSLPLSLSLAARLAVPVRTRAGPIAERRCLAIQFLPGAALTSAIDWWLRISSSVIAIPLMCVQMAAALDPQIAPASRSGFSGDWVLESASQAPADVPRTLLYRRP
jgi:hypothetical protein